MIRETAHEIEDAAARWVARMETADWDQEGERELAAWIATDPRRDGALLRAQAALALLDGRADAVPAPARRGGIRRRHLLAGGGLAVAASLAGLALLSRSATYATDIGEIRRLPLADGSTAAINTASTIEVALRNDQREVILSKGEAWFQVAKDPRRPFIVSAGGVRVRAVGTAFSVRRRNGGADVLVTEGVVEVWTAGVEASRVKVAAGARIFIGDDAAVERGTASASAVDRTLAWRDGKIDLAGQPLGQAVAEINRYNRRKLVIADPALSREQFDGVFRTDDPVGFARTIETVLGVPVDYSETGRIMIGEASN